LRINFTCILFVFLVNVVTLCECHSEIKGYLLTYLLTNSIPKPSDNNSPDSANRPSARKSTTMISEHYRETFMGDEGIQTGS